MFCGGVGGGQGFPEPFGFVRGWYNIPFMWLGWVVWICGWWVGSVVFGGRVLCTGVILSARLLVFRLWGGVGGFYWFGLRCGCCQWVSWADYFRAGLA